MEPTRSRLDLDVALEQALTAAEIGQEILLDYFGHLTQVCEKQQAGLVSEADVKSEEAIVQCLLSKFPQHEIIGEEQSFQLSHQGPVLQNNQTPVWIVDPLDGTTNYVHGFHIFCISIGLCVNNQVVLGVVDVPKLDQTFYAVKGKGAFVREVKGERPLSVSKCEKLHDALLGTGFFGGKKGALLHQMKVFTSLIQQTRGIRRPGSAAYDLCMVADGVYDGFWEMNLNPWDTAGGSILVSEAGGLVSNYAGDLYHVEMDSILAVSPNLQEPMIREIAKAI